MLDAMGIGEPKFIAAGDEEYFARDLGLVNTGCWLDACSENEDGDPPWLFPVGFMAVMTLDKADTFLRRTGLGFVVALRPCEEEVATGLDRSMVGTGTIPGDARWDFSGPALIERSFNCIGKTALSGKF